MRLPIRPHLGHYTVLLYEIETKMSWQNWRINADTRKESSQHAFFSSLSDIIALFIVTLLYARITLLTNRVLASSFWRLDSLLLPVCFVVNGGCHFPEFPFPCFKPDGRLTIRDVWAMIETEFRFQTGLCLALRKVGRATTNPFYP